MSTIHNYDYLLTATPEKLVELFNREVGNPHWVSARGFYLDALRQAFQKNSIDYSCVANSSGGFKLAKGNDVFLEGKHLKLSKYYHFSKAAIGLVIGDYKLESPSIHHLSIDYPLLNVNDELKANDALFLFVNHGKQSTYINFNTIKNCYLIGFQKEMQTQGSTQYSFNSAMYINNSGDGGFSHISQADIFYLVNGLHFGYNHILQLNQRASLLI